jgi:hypothetical protein
VKESSEGPTRDVFHDDTTQWRFPRGSHKVHNVGMVLELGQATNLLNELAFKLGGISASANLEELHSHSLILVDPLVNEAMVA